MTAQGAILLACIIQLLYQTPPFCNNNHHEDVKFRQGEVHHTLDSLQISKQSQNHSS